MVGLYRQVWRCIQIFLPSSLAVFTETSHNSDPNINCIQLLRNGSDSILHACSWDFWAYKMYVWWLGKQKKMLSYQDDIHLLCLSSLINCPAGVMRLFQCNVGIYIVMKTILDMRTAWYEKIIGSSSKMVILNLAVHWAAVKKCGSVNVIP